MTFTKRLNVAYVVRSRLITCLKIRNDLNKFMQHCQLLLFKIFINKDGEIEQMFMRFLFINRTRKPSCRDATCRCPENFLESLTTPTATFPDFL